MGRDTTFGWISLGGLNSVPVKVPCPSPSKDKSNTFDFLFFNGGVLVRMGFRIRTTSVSSVAIGLMETNNLPVGDWCGMHDVCISKLDLETEKFECSISFDFPMNDWNIDFSSSIALLVACALATTLLNSPFRSACDFSRAAILAASPVVSPCSLPFPRSPKKNGN